MLIFNIILGLLLLIIISRIYISIKGRKNRLKGYVIKAWQNGQKKANDIYRNKSAASLKKLINSNILLSIAIKNKKGSKSENFELAYITLAETVSMKYFLERTKNENLPYLNDENEINRLVKKDVFSIFREKSELEKYFLRSLTQGYIPDEYKEDIHKILIFITDIEKLKQIEQKK